MSSNFYNGFFRETTGRTEVSKKGGKKLQNHDNSIAVNIFLCNFDQLFLLFALFNKLLQVIGIKFIKVSVDYTDLHYLYSLCRKVLLFVALEDENCSIKDRAKRGKEAGVSL